MKNLRFNLFLRGLLGKFEVRIPKTKLGFKKFVNFLKVRSKPKMHIFANQYNKIQLFLCKCIGPFESNYVCNYSQQQKNFFCLFVVVGPKKFRGIDR